MLRQNFGHGSGAVVDYCKQHGVWFEADKLTRYLDWIRSGGASSDGPSSSLSAFQIAARDELAVRKRVATAGIEPLIEPNSAVGPSWHGLLDGLSDWFGNWL